MADYSAYFVGDLKTGEYVGKKPWLSPDDGWPVLLNAYVDKGILKRRNGYVTLCDLAEISAITGIGAIQYNGYYEVIVCLPAPGYGYFIRLHQDGTFTYLENAESVFDYFTSLSTDYFWFQEYNSKLYFVNGVNFIQKYTPGINGYQAMNTGAVTIQTCKMLFSYKNRLIFVSPKIGGIWYPDYIYYTDVNLENVAATNFVKAPSPSDTPVTGGYVGDIPIVFCRNGNIYHIAYTQNADAPFTWDKRSGDFGAQARMGCIAFKDNLAVIGLNRLLAYDRYQAREYDLAVRGIFDQFHSTNIVNSYSALMKDRNFIYTAYTRPGQTQHDRILAFNFDEGNFAEFSGFANCLFSLNGPWLPKDDFARDWTSVAINNSGGVFIMGNWATVSVIEPLLELYSRGHLGRLYTNRSSYYTGIERRPAGDVNKNWKCVAMDGDFVYFIAGVYGGRLYKSIDKAFTWSETQPAGDADKNWSALAVSSYKYSNYQLPYTYWYVPFTVAAVYGGRLYTSLDKGVIWTERQPAGDANKNWSAVACSDGNKAYGVTPTGKIIAAIYSGRLYISSDCGDTWSETQPAGDTNKYWQCVASDSDGSVLIAGVTGGRLYMSIDGGTTWTEIQPKGNANGNWYSVDCDGDGSFIVVGEADGRLYTSSNSGSTWTERQPAGASNTKWAGVACNYNGSEIVVVQGKDIYGYPGYAWYSSNGGVAWTKAKVVATGNYFPIRAQDHQKYNLTGSYAGGLVRRIDSGNLDGAGSISTDIQSAQFNPFQKEGYKAKLGWVKFLVTAANNVSFNISLYKDHSTTAFKSVRLDCDTIGNPGDKHWETIYANGEVGEYFQIKIQQAYHTGLDNVAGLEIHGLLLGFKRAGRIGKVTDRITPVPAFITYPATSDNGAYTVSWGSSSGASSYQLERSKDGGAYANIYTGALTSRNESGLLDGSYRYRVRACSVSCSDYRTGDSDCIVTLPPPVSLVINASATPASIDTGGDVNWFSFVVTIEGVYTIETMAGTLLDTVMYLYGINNQSTLIEEDDDGGVDYCSLISRTLAIGTYYVKVKGYDSEDIGTYSIQVRSGV